jgi:hypothetical protein
MDDASPIRRAVERAARGEGLSPAEHERLARWLLEDPTQTAFFGVTDGTAGEAVSERARLLRPVAAAVEAAPLRVAGFEERAAVSLEELFLYHIPLAQELADRCREAPARFLVAVVAVPGGGKSVFAELMGRVLAAAEPELHAAVLGIDGYHYPNAVLESQPPPAGAEGAASLRDLKGAPFTFDVQRLAADLRRVRGARDRVLLPAYDRTLHDPVEDRLAVKPEDRLVLVEGNWLLYDHDGWQAVGPLFDLALVLDLPAGANRERLLARHRRGGRSREDALGHFKRVDRPNTERVAATRPRADILVHLDADYRIQGIEEQ